MTRDEYDNPWKDIVETLFPDFLAFFLPVALTDFDKSKPVEFLDKELNQLFPDSESGGRIVDKLIKVPLHEEQEQWVLVHVEIQGSQQPDFARRMYNYSYRLWDRYQRDIASLAILTDDNAKWRPDCFVCGKWGTQTEHRFPLRKLLDYELTELEASANPFAMVVRSHREALRTKGEAASRYDAKKGLLFHLGSKGYSREQTRAVFRFIDWVLKLPEELDQRLTEELRAQSGETLMPYISNFERIVAAEALAKGRVEGRVEGRVKGRIESLVKLVGRRYPEQSAEVIEARLAALTCPEALDQLGLRLFDDLTWEQLWLDLPL